MPDPGQQMKPQDTVIYLLGKLDGQVSSVHESLTSHTSAQLAINAENKREHDEFSRDIAQIQATQPVKVSPWAKAGTIIAIPASLVALVGFIITYFQPR